MRKIPRISDSEWNIMKLFWENSPRTANDIIENLSHSKTWSPKTVKSLINRLVKKGALDFEKKGRVYSYFPLVSKSECIRIEKKSILAKLYDGELQAMLKSFIEDEEFTDEDIHELTEILKTKGKNNDTII
jgi:BlaI family transcriptional regulator, penicillinase repressor